MPPTIWERVLTVSDKNLQANLRFAAATPSYRRKSSDLRRAAREVSACSTDFDAASWLAVVEEQKLAIALAAGVDPSKVRIRIGH